MTVISDSGNLSVKLSIFMSNVRVRRLYLIMITSVTAPVVTYYEQKTHSPLASPQSGITIHRGSNQCEGNAASPVSQ